MITNIVYIAGDENVVADALSRINAITMPTKLDAQTSSEAQEEANVDSHDSDSTSLKLQPLHIDGHRIFCDISTGVVRPFLPPSLRRAAFEVVHGLAHPSGRETCRQLKEKFIWPGIKKQAL